MKYNEILKYLDCNVECYKKGLYTIPELLHVIEKDIRMETNYIYDTDKRIARENKLYKHAFKRIITAIDYLEKHG